MIYRIAQTINGHIVVDEITDIFAWAEIRNLEVVAIKSNPRIRPELNGQPIFGSMIGPFWDGDAVRYEDETTHDRLSA